MDAIMNFLAMEGYWPYVWPAFGIAAAVMIGLLVASLRTLRAREAELKALQAHRERTAGGAPRGRGTEGEGEG